MNERANGYTHNSTYVQTAGEGETTGSVPDVSAGSRRDLEILAAIEDFYTPHIRPFLAFLRARDLGLELGSVRAYFEHLNTTDWTAATKRIRRAAVKRRLRQLAGAGSAAERDLLERALRDMDRAGVAAAPKSSTVAVHAQKVLAPDEVNRLLAGARSERQYCFVKLLYATGLRVSEACGIKIGHANREADRVRIRVHGKGNRERWVIVPASLYDQVRACFAGELYLLETAGGKAYSRSYVSSQIARLGRDLLRRRISAHTLRHSFATRMLARGAPAEAVSRYLGHASVRTTLDLYCHAELGEPEIAAFVAELV